MRSARAMGPADWLMRRRLCQTTSARVSNAWASGGVHENEIPCGAPLVSTSALSLVPEQSALSPFRWELPERELFRRLKDDPHTAGETFSAKSAIVLLLTLLSAHSPKPCGTHPRGWAGDPPKCRTADTPALLRFVNRGKRGCGVNACANAFLHN